MYRKTLNFTPSMDPLKVPSGIRETETDVPIVFSESSRRAGGVAARREPVEID